MVLSDWVSVRIGARLTETVITIARSGTVMTIGISAAGANIRPGTIGMIGTIVNIAVKTAAIAGITATDNMRLI